MAEGIVQVTEGTGKKLHTWNRTIGANSVEDEFTIPGEYPYASYVADAQSITGANTGDDLLALQAGASLPVRIRYIRVSQRIVITAAQEFSVDVIRLSAAGTGGTALTPRPFDSADAASGATCQSGVPNATHGTAGVTLFSLRIWAIQTAPAGGLGIVQAEWQQKPNQKPIIIPAGTANGLALRVQTGRAGIFLEPTIEFVETNFV